RRSALSMLSPLDNVSKRSDAEGRGPAEWLEDAIARDPVLGRLLPQLRRLAANASPALIFGEPGTGAELVARAIHDLSRRAGHPARVAAGLFREDLHARLAAELLTLPPLRERPEDIPALAHHFLEQCCAHLGPRELGPEAEELLQRYRWPGNLRELRETVEEAALQ